MSRHAKPESHDELIVRHLLQGFPGPRVLVVETGVIRIWTGLHLEDCRLPQLGGVVGQSAVIGVKPYIPQLLQLVPRVLLVQDRLDELLHQRRPAVQVVVGPGAAVRVVQDLEPPQLVEVVYAHERGLLGPRGEDLQRPDHLARQVQVDDVAAEQVGFQSGPERAVHQVEGEDVGHGQRLPHQRPPVDADGPHVPAEVPEVEETAAGDVKMRRRRRKGIEPLVHEEHVRLGIEPGPPVPGRAVAVAVTADDVIAIAAAIAAVAGPPLGSHTAPPAAEHTACSIWS